MLISRFSKRLEDETAMNGEAARWAVESWALALDMLGQKSSLISTKTEDPPKECMPVFTAPNGKVGKTYRACIQANGLDRATICDVQLPEELNLIFDAVSGEIRGVPKEPGRYSLPLQWKKSNGEINFGELPIIITYKELSPDIYHYHNDGTLTDIKMGLQWMRCSLGQLWQNGTCAGEARKYTFDQALEAIEILNKSSGYAGFRDWRLPTKDELLTLVHSFNDLSNTWHEENNESKDNAERPTIIHSAFPNTPPWGYRTSSSHNSIQYGIWNVSFKDGHAYASYRNLDYHVRLVRSDG